MRYYQLAFLLPPNLKKEEIAQAEQEILSLLEKEGGILDKKEDPLKRSLFYEIKKFREAYLGSVYFFMEPEKMKSFNEKLKMKKEILRYLIVTETPPKKVPIKKKVAKPKKVEIEEIEEKLKEILGE